MNKQQILDDMLVKHEACLNDWQNKEKWEAYVNAWKAWRQVKGDE